MPKYFFNIYHMRPNLDPEGEELPDGNAAMRAAIRSAGEILGDPDIELTPGLEWRLEVIDDAKNVIWVIRVNAERVG
jgi:hypothetical protein